MLKGASACTARRGFLPGSSQTNSLKRTTPKLMDEKRALLDKDYSKCEGKIKDFYTFKRICQTKRHVSGDHGSINMTSTMMSQLTLSVRSPCVISLRIEQIGEVLLCMMRENSFKV